MGLIRIRSPARCSGADAGLPGTGGPPGRRQWLSLAYYEMFISQ